MDVPHHYIVDNFLTDHGEAGQVYDLMIEAYAGHFFPQSPLGGCATGPVLPGSYTDPKANGPRTALGKMTYGIWNEDAYQLYMDLQTLSLLADQLDPESLRADRVAAALEQASLIIDFEQPLEARVDSYHEARKALSTVLMACNGSTAPVFYAIGNAHLDLAWLWPMAETHRKTSRTFAQQLRLLEAYPEYKYLQSQPAAYEMCREHYPELYDRIVDASKRGQWIAEGAMWVEPDTNMTSGESLVRQLLHGKRWFKENLGIDSVVLWLPDTFGYSAALPQILNGTGVRYLVTQKIFWSYNEGDQFPYHYFTWRGADGSEIDTFLPTSYTYRTDPKEICETWNKRVQKRDLDAFLLPFGYGDGGGPIYDPGHPTDSGRHPNSGYSFDMWQFHPTSYTIGSAVSENVVAVAVWEYLEYKHQSDTTTTPTSTPTPTVSRNSASSNEAGYLVTVENGAGTGRHKAGEVVTVKDGYARNYLLPKDLAAPVTKHALRRLEKLRKEREELAKLQLAEANAKAAQLIRKPLVCEEFGFPRDGFDPSRNAPTTLRDAYYAYVFSRVGDALQGVNFWGWSGFAQPAHTQWEHGDPYTGDPAQEAQGLNGVYVTDSTIGVITDAIANLK